jgi:hypothetical protein
MVPAVDRLHADLSAGCATCYDPCGANIRFLHELGEVLVDEGDAAVDEAVGRPVWTGGR